MWFQDDDFTWITMSRVFHEHGLWHVLFTPFAQGTVRILGDRLYFLTLSELFGSQLWPYRLTGLATFLIGLTLVLLVGEKLTGSRAAGVMAALVWAASANSTPSVVWIASYYQLLCAACLLGALYSRLRGWRAAEWVFYVAGFGAMEITPMYPAVALLCAWPEGRKKVREALWLFVPAVLYTAYHFLFVPKSANGPYVLKLDSRLPSTIATYLGWSFEPGSSALGARRAELQAPELLLGMILGLTLAWFLVRCLMRREWMAAVCAGWFVAFLAPVLLLPNHVTSYYLTIPSIGLAWLAGWAIVRAWEAKGFARLAAAGLAAAYFVGSAAGVEAQTRWFARRAQRIHAVYDGVAAAAAAHPSDAVVLEGVDEELYQSGIYAHPFLLVPLDRVWVVPKDVDEQGAHALAAQGRARVLEVRGTAVSDVTERFN